MQSIITCSISQPAVLHALLALSSRHQMAISANQGLGRRSDDVYGLSQYNQAVRCINSRLQHSHPETDAVEEPLVCFLLMCFELLGDGDLMALVHLEGALAILCMGNKSKTPGECSPIHSQISRVYSGLDILATTFVGSRIPSPETTQDTIALPLPLFSGLEKTLSHLRRRLTELEQRSLYFIRVKSQGLNYATPDDLADGKVNQRFLNCQAERAEITHQLREWSVVLDECGKSGQTEFSFTLRQEYLILKARQIGLTISIYNSLEPDQTNFDNLHNHFEDLVRFSEEFVASLDQASSKHLEIQGPSSRFTLDAGIIYPLYLTALKCRDRNIRQCCVQLLSRCGREGPWDGCMMSQIAKEVIALEESLACKGAIGKEVSRDKGEDLVMWIPEDARVHSVAINVNRLERFVDMDCRVRVWPQGTAEKEARLLGWHWSDCKSRVTY
jgi:hypothetical protein